MFDFPKSCRLLKTAEFDVVFEGGKKAACSSMVVFAREGKAGSNAKMGLVVSRKVGNSVVRNRIKRVLREIFRHKRTLITPGNTELVVVARQRLTERTFDQVWGDLRYCLKKLGAVHG